MEQRHSHSSGKTSNLVISHKSKQQQKEIGCIESFDPQKVDVYLTIDFNSDIYNYQEVF